MIQFTLSVPDDLLQWVEHRVAQGHFIDAGEYIRDLVRRDLDEPLRPTVRKNDVASVSQHLGGAAGVEPAPR